MKKHAIKISILLICSVFYLIGCSSDDNTVEGEEPTPTLSPDTQNIVINVDDYQHQFLGGGVSIGLFLGHHYSMGAAAQDKAIQYMAKDCNMQYFQDYIEIYPSDNPDYFDRRADYVKAAKAYQPDLKFSLVGNKFPVNLMRDQVVGSETLKVLDTQDSEIYTKLADWWFKLFKGFHDRGVNTEILNVVNEPDLNRTFRKYHYGLDGDTKEAVSQVFKKSVPIFLNMFDDGTINTTGMAKPLIMGPSTISPVGCLEYMDYFKSNHSDVWELIDIVATHQYENGARDDLFNRIKNESDGKLIYQSETHALRGDELNFGSILISRDLEATLSLANLFTTAINNGVSSWFYFENNYPNVVVDPGGLLSIPWAASEPVPYKHYYAFKQLTSAQPSSSHVLSYTSNNSNQTDIIVFRKQDENAVYLHYSNYGVKTKELTISLSGNETLTSYTVTTTDDKQNEVITSSGDISSQESNLKLEIGGLSVNTIKISFTN